MRQLLLFVCSFALALAAPVAQERATSEVVGPSFEISVSPRTQILFISKPALVRLRITLKNVDERYWCPFVHVNWGDGDASGRDADCEPFEEVTDEERRQVTYRYSHWYRRMGTMKITVYLLDDDDKVFARRQTDVQIIR